MAAQSFRENPELDTETVISELGVGEALVSTLQARGIPSMVQRTLIRPPSSRIGPASDAERAAVLEHDPNRRRYAEAVDRESAHEKLLARAEAQREASAEAELEKREKSAQRSTGRRRESSSEAFVKSMARSLGSSAGRSLGKKLFRGLLGSLLR